MADLPNGPTSGRAVRKPADVRAGRPTRANAGRTSTSGSRAPALRLRQPRFHRGPHQCPRGADVPLPPARRRRRRDGVARGFLALRPCAAKKARCLEHASIADDVILQSFHQALYLPNLSCLDPTGRSGRKTGSYLLHSGLPFSRAKAMAAGNIQVQRAIGRGPGSWTPSTTAVRNPARRGGSRLPGAWSSSCGSARRAITKAWVMS